MKNKIKSLAVMLWIFALCTCLVACGEAPSPASVPPASDTPAKTVVDTEKAEVPASADEELERGFGLIEDFEEIEALDENPDRAIIRAAAPILQNVVTKLDGSCTRSEIYLYRSNLSDTYKQAYDLLRAGIVEGKASIQLTVPVAKEDIKEIFLAVFYDGPDLFWLQGGYSYSYNNYGEVTKITPKYNELAADLPGNRAKFEAAVSEALADMWSLSDPTAQVKYAHDYLTNTVTYDMDSAYNQTAYSALVNKSSVCAGYTRAFQYMMQKMDIPCAYLTGTAFSSGSAGNHAWNIVELDGEFYAIDVTWDDPLGNKPDKYYYDYFNLPDSTFSADHVRGDASALLPAANGTAKSFSAAFDGKQYGTDFAAIKGVLPEGYGTASTAFIGEADGGEADISSNPYLN